MILRRRARVSTRRGGGATRCYVLLAMLRYASVVRALASSGGDVRGRSKGGVYEGCVRGVSRGGRDGGVRARAGWKTTTTARGWGRGRRVDVGRGRARPRGAGVRRGSDHLREGSLERGGVHAREGSPGTVRARAEGDDDVRGRAAHERAPPSARVGDHATVRVERRAKLAEVHRGVHRAERRARGRGRGASRRGRGRRALVARRVIVIRPTPRLVAKRARARRQQISRPGRVVRVRGLATRRRALRPEPATPSHARARRRCDARGSTTQPGATVARIGRLASGG